ncbi:MAG: hypothetical protein AAF193_02305 [Bacteroidota bacterium]
MEQTANEQLQIISEAIRSTKNNIGNQRIFYVMWGWLVVISSLAHFGMLKMHYAMPWLPWMILMPIGGILAAILGRRQKQSASYQTYLDRALSLMWISLGIGFIAAVVVSIVLRVSPSIFTLILAGIGTLASGLITKFRPLQLGGIVLLAGGITCAFIPMEWQLLVNAGAIVFGYLLPAYMIKGESNGIA